MSSKPSAIQTAHLERCVQGLSQALEWLGKTEPGETAHAVGQAACVKELEVAHDYGRELARDALQLLPEFISDARALAEAVRGPP